MGRKTIVKKEIDLSELPKWEKGGKAKEGTTKWKESIGYKIKGNYDSINFEFIIDNKNSNILTIIYNNKKFTISINNIINCKVGNILGKCTSDFKIEIGQRLVDDKRDITIIDREYRIRYDKNSRKYNDKWYKYHCNKDGYESWMIEHSLIQKHGCSCCSGHVVLQGINDIPTTANWLIPYFQGGIEEAKLYTKHGGGNINNRDSSIIPICPDCGRIFGKKVKINDIYRYKTIKCSCGDSISYPNKMMFNILEQLKVEFEVEYSPDWIRLKRYDFYIPTINTIIEMDGRWHTKDNNMSGQTKEDSKIIDDYKDKLALEHGIKVVRINCDLSDLDYIKNNILQNKILNNLFDLHKIDWLKAEEFALSNLVKEACEYKKNNSNLSTIEIGKIMKLDKGTIVRYLKKGSKIWDWIDYNAKDEKFKSGSKSGKMKRKPIEIFKNSISLGIFSSRSDLERQSEKLFGTKLFSENMSLVCRNKMEFYKGYTFKYLTPEEIEKFKQQQTLTQAI